MTDELRKRLTNLRTFGLSEGQHLLLDDVLQVIDNIEAELHEDYELSQQQDAESLLQSCQY